MKIIKFFWINSEKISHWATVLGIVVAAIGGYLAYSQLAQANEHRSWQNYNDMNIRYADLYKEIPEDIATGCISKDFAATSHESQRWVRQYFNLYSEEYWLYLNDLIPKEMWTKRINGGVRVNLSKYPELIAGYRYWKGKGAFTHPTSFKSEVEAAIKDASKISQPKRTECTTISSIKQK